MWVGWVPGTIALQGPVWEMLRRVLCLAFFAPQNWTYHWKLLHTGITCLKLLREGSLFSYSFRGFSKRISLQSQFPHSAKKNPKDPSVLKLVRRPNPYCFATAVAFQYPYRFPASFSQTNKHFWALSVAFCFVRTEFTPRTEIHSP